MKLNCKPGDLAVVVTDRFTFPRGTLVEVIEWNQFERWAVVFLRPVKDIFGIPTSTASIDDCDLRPIRDNDGADETLTWAPRLKGVPA